ncbi:MAG: DNA ligase D [Candidatus Binatia bacterium]
MPESIRPELCTLVTEAPDGAEWFHEIKFDGYRIVARVDSGRVSLLSRNGKDWTARFPEVARALATLPVTQALFDGEIGVVEPDGTTNFQALQNALGEGEKREFTYLLFDLLYLDGYDLCAATLRRRKGLLADVLGHAGNHDGVLKLSDHVEGRGREFHRQACEHGLEGIISKLAESPYRQVRSREWRKTKCLQAQEFVLGGYTDGTGTRTGFGALLLGVQEKDVGLRYAGKVGTGFTEKSLRQIAARLSKLARRQSPFLDIPDAVARGAHWIEPTIVAEVSFLGWTRDGKLRHPTFRGLREDRDASHVVREFPATLRPGSEANGPATSRRKARLPAKPAKAAPTPGRVEGIAISNSSKVLYPDPGVTKGELAAYYAAVAPWILPHVAGRPLTILRCPDGYDGECFFQKNAAGLPPEIERVAIPNPKGGKDSTYGVVRDAAGLVALLQLGALEFHIWGSKVEHLEKPDRIVFDLDPGPGVPWREVVEGAHFVRATLAKLGLTSLALLTGGKGVHVVLFVKPEYGWAIVKEFAHAVVKSIVRSDPARYTAHLAKVHRQGKIFLDYLRNGRGATAVAPYSTRSRPGAPVAVPIDWKELIDDIAPDEFHVRDLQERLQRLKADPWTDAAAAPQSLQQILEGSGSTVPVPPKKGAKPAKARRATAPLRAPSELPSRPADKLARYRSKRDFGRTPEPQGESTHTWRKTGNPYFVIQKHAASRLHYDFRLEVDGVLKSWAVPKGPSMDPRVKRLAVEVEDHPIEYADFEGTIPKDEYGGGTVLVWDAGPYRNLKAKSGKEVPLPVCHDNGRIEVWLEGKKIRGGFALVRTRMDEQGKNWLLVKMKDEAATGEDPVSEKLNSVLSGRTIEEVAARPGRV